MPGLGNSQHDLSFVVPPLKGEKSLTSTKASLSTATMAVAYAFLANKLNYKPLLPKAFKQYSRALKQVNKALQDPEKAVSDQTLATVIILSLFEVSYGFLTVILHPIC